MIYILMSTAFKHLMHVLWLISDNVLIVI